MMIIIFLNVKIIWKEFVDKVKIFEMIIKIYMCMYI